VLIAPTIGLDASILTLLVVQAFGAAALGLFRSLPFAYVGGLVIGVGAALAQHYVQSVSFMRPLSGLPASLPFLLLFSVLILAPRRRLVDIAPERRRPLPQRASLSPLATALLSGAGLTAILLVPSFAGTRLIGYTSGMAFVIIFLSLVLLDRYSGQLSLAQLAFCAVGGTAFSHFTVGLGMPWLIGVLLGGLVAVPVGALLAIPAVRLSGLYLALATFGFGLLMQNLFYGQSYMFGFGAASVQAPRPSIAQSDTAYYYLLLVFAVLVAALVVGVRRSSLGRLLRAMADSPTALATGGMNVTALRVLIFCLSSFIAGLGGALLGPVTGELASANLDTFSSLLLVVILALQVFLPDVPAAFAAAFASQVLPGYLVSHQTWHDVLPVIFGVSAVIVAVLQASPEDAHARVPSRHRSSEERLRRSPVRSRLVERPRLAGEVTS
jgi:ABC-type branched-subunit amino acid transport system permease subunit